MQDFRKNRGEVSIDPELISRGEQQLCSEISLLTQWLQALRASSDQCAFNSNLISTYQDMLRSRQDMLVILRKQAKIKDRK